MLRFQMCQEYGVFIFASASRSVFWSTTRNVGLRNATQCKCRVHSALSVFVATDMSERRHVETCLIDCRNRARRVPAPSWA